MIHSLTCVLHELPHATFGFHVRTDVAVLGHRMARISAVAARLTKLPDGFFQDFAVRAALAGEATSGAKLALLTSPVTRTDGVHACIACAL